MPIGPTASLLRLHLSEGDRFEGRPLHEAILDKCMELGVTGATVFRGLEGYGETAEIHRHHLMRRDQPILVMVIDQREVLDRLIPVVENMMDTGLIAISEVSVKRVRRPR